MSFSWMRRIDLWAGKTILHVLSWFTRQSRSLNGDWAFTKPPKRVICTKFIGLGSIVLSLPLLKALKESGVKIAFWSFPGQAELVRIAGYADEVWVIKPTFRDFIPTLWKTWLKARRLKADAFLDLEPTSLFSTILSRLSGAPMRVGFISAKPLRERFYTHLVALTPERHIIENNLKMANFLAVPTPQKPPLPPVPKAPPQVQSPLARHPGRTRIVININSSDLSWHRMWEDDSWVELGHRLLEDPNVELVFPGVSSELPRVLRVMKRINDPSRVFNLAGKSTLVQLLLLLEDSDLVISVDSGIMHLAAWANVPLVGLFGPETPSLFSPRSPKAKWVWAGLPCSPCLSSAADKITRCKDNQCMKQITPSQVYQVAINSLHRHLKEQNIRCA